RGTNGDGQTAGHAQTHKTLEEQRPPHLPPRHTHLKADAEPLPSGEFAFTRVELFPVAHVFRAGSRMRISVETPGGNRPLWTFATLKLDNAAVNFVRHSRGHPSRLVLGLVAH